MRDHKELNPNSARYGVILPPSLMLINISNPVILINISNPSPNNNCVFFSVILCNLVILCTMDIILSKAVTQ